MKNFIIILMGLFVLGCTATKNISYDQINFKDGIDEYEAISIALRELEKYPNNEDFVRIGKVNNNKRINCLKNHWLITFKQKQLSMLDWYYFVIVNKQSGAVVRSSEMFPKSNYWAAMVHHIDGCYE